MEKCNLTQVPCRKAIMDVVQANKDRRSLAYSAGADVKAVSEILGHASTSVTIDTYAHLTEEKKRKQEEVIKTIKVL